jgi:UDP-N-acetylglucosamine--dolichyl-phosphate N-acetylglucosaminephosphotransferase
LLPSLAEAGLLLLSFIVPFSIVLVATPSFASYLSRSGRLADDVHKLPPTKVPFPAGPLLFLAVLVGELLVFIYFGSFVPLAVIGSAAIAFLVGLTDDLFVLGGRTKPLLLLVAAFPLVGLALLQPDLYQSSLTFPILGKTSEHFTIYTSLAILAFPVVANAFNMMDSFNGQISGFTLLTSLALLAGVVLRTVYSNGLTFGRSASVLPLVAVAAAFLVFNRYPSKVFDGDSGALMFGAMYAALAVTSGVEIAAIIAIVPSILNSYYILSSVRGLVERRKMRSRPTYLGGDGRLYASHERNAPVTLARMILLDGPMTEREIVGAIVGLTGIACILSFVTSVITWVL